MPDPLWSRSKRFFLAGTVFVLLALKFRATLAAGIDLPATGSDWFSPTGWNAWLTARNGQWDPFLLRLGNSIFESVVAGVCISLIARCCRPSNGGGWAVLLNSGIQIIIASSAPPPLVESWREPWFVALLCGSVLVFSHVRRLRMAVLAAFIVVTSAVWWSGGLRPAPLEDPTPGDPRGQAVRNFLESGRTADLPPHPGAGTESLTAALGQPTVRSRLPLSARSALPLSQPLKSDFGYIAVSARRKGELGSPAAVTLRRADGQRITAIQGELPADRAWHRLNLPVPAGQFSIEVQGDVETGPAIEYAAGSRNAGKALRSWPLFAGLALICALGGVLCLVIPNERHGWKLAWNPRESRLLPWLGLVAYAGVLLPFLDTYAGGSDSAGYLGSARLLQHFQLSAVTPLPQDLASYNLPAAGFLPRGFALGGPAKTPAAASMVPTYPVGLPLLVCLALWSLPAIAAVPAVIVSHLLGGLILTYLLAGLLGLPRPWALGAAAWVGLCPLYLFMGLQPMSDVPSLVWITGAVVLALRVRAPRRVALSGSGERLPPPARPECGLALACGAVTAVAVLLRPANVLALPVVALALWGRPRAVLCWILGGVPFAVLQTFYNQKLYGRPFLTGYGSAGGLFSAQWIAPTLLHYGHWLPLLLTPAVAGAFFLPFRSSISGSTRLLLGGWAALFLAFYATYSCTHETWWYLRFVLPAVPPLVVSTLLILRALSPGGSGASRRAGGGPGTGQKAPPPRRRGLVLVTTLAVAGWLLCLDCCLHVLDSARGNRVYQESSLWLEQNAPADALVVCSYTSGALYYYSHRAFFQPSSPDQAAQVVTAAAAAHRPLYAEFFKFDQQPLAWFAGGHWAEVHRSGDIIVWHWVSA
jgi:hypothetical protein